MAVMLVLMVLIGGCHEDFNAADVMVDVMGTFHCGCRGCFIRIIEKKPNNFVRWMMELINGLDCIACMMSAG
ncbi:hypothetical protein Hanom_Chr01g00026131 [Helianthus anomalus]